MIATSEQSPYTPIDRSISPAEIQMNFQPDRSKFEYINAIREALEAIGRGENYQLCLTNHFEAPLNDKNTFSVEQGLQYYLKLRLKNPAPFSAYLR